MMWAKFREINKERGRTLELASNGERHQHPKPEGAGQPSCVGKPS